MTTDTSYADEENTEAREPSKETKIRLEIEQLAGLKVEEDEEGHETTTINPELFSKNQIRIVNLLNQCANFVMSRADSEKSFEQADLLRKLIDPDVNADAFQGHYHILKRVMRKPTIEDAPTLKQIEEYDDMEFLIDDWMPADRLTILTGRGGTGKSFLALQYIVGLAIGIRGQQFSPKHIDIDDQNEIENWGPPVEELIKPPIKIVIASYEEDLLETWKRILTICRWLGWPKYDALKTHIRFVDLKMFGPIWGVEDQEHLAHRARLLDVGVWLFDQCQQYEARLLMLDPSAGVYGGNENARESVREFCSYLNGWGQEVGCATLLIAHPPKTEAAFSGSTDWLGSCRALWTLRAESENRGSRNGPDWHHWYQLNNMKQNYTAPQKSIILRKIRDENRWTPIWERCSKEDAETFYSDYHETNSENATIQEEPFSDADSIL